MKKEGFYEWYCKQLKGYLQPTSSLLELESTISGLPLLNLRGSFRLYVSANISAEHLKSLEREGKVEGSEKILVDCAVLPFVDGCFDLVHITFPSTRMTVVKGKTIKPTFYCSRLTASIGEVDRVLKNGGVMAIYSPVLSYSSRSGRDEISVGFERLGYRNESKGGMLILVKRDDE